MRSLLHVFGWLVLVFLPAARPSWPKLFSIFGDTSRYSFLSRSSSPRKLGIPFSSSVLNVVAPATWGSHLPLVLGLRLRGLRVSGPVAQAPKGDEVLSGVLARWSADCPLQT